MYGNDFIKSVNFFNWIRRKMRTNVSFLSNVLFSGEANFANTGNVNRHNMHYWANENPRWMRTVPFLHPWSVDYWCGIVGDHVIGPYSFEGRLTGQVYANFLQNVLTRLMEDAPLHVRMSMWMQHDDAPPYYALCSRQVMNEIFDEKWIGRGRFVAWSPRSPDLTSPDYFLWGFIKGRVMAVAPTTPDDMKERIRRACTEITPQMLTEVKRSFHQRINRCLQVKGQHFEHLL